VLGALAPALAARVLRFLSVRELLGVECVRRAASRAVVGADIPRLFLLCGLGMHVRSDGARTRCRCRASGRPPCTTPHSGGCTACGSPRRTRRRCARRRRPRAGARPGLCARRGALLVAERALAGSRSTARCTSARRTSGAGSRSRSASSRGTRTTARRCCCADPGSCPAATTRPCACGTCARARSSTRSTSRSPSAASTFSRRRVRAGRVRVALGTALTECARARRGVRRGLPRHRARARVQRAHARAAPAALGPPERDPRGRAQRAHARQRGRGQGARRLGLARGHEGRALWPADDDEHRRQHRRRARGRARGERDDRRRRARVLDQ
jgi:hypothetical protein